MFVGSALLSPEDCLLDPGVRKCTQAGLNQAFTLTGCFFSMDGLGLGPIILSKGKCEDLKKCLLLARPFVSSLGSFSGIIDFAAQTCLENHQKQKTLPSSSESSASLNMHFAVKRASTEPRKTDFTPWDGTRYQRMRILRSASKHWPCQVETHWDDVLSSTVGVKRFPSSYISDSPEDFRISQNRHEKNPWQEILLLEKINLKGSGQKHPSLECNGIFYDAPTGDVLLVCKKVPEGDVFEFCQNLGPPGPEREYNALLVFESLLRAVQELHKMGIAHGNIRAETVWLHSIGHCQYEALLFDIAVGSPDFLPGDAVYRAPELSSKPGFVHLQLEERLAADLFACGVLGFALAMGRYPWFSTAPGACKAFEFARTQGIAKFLSSFSNPGTKRGAMSSEYQAKLAHLLSLEPSERQSPICDDPP